MGHPDPPIKSKDSLPKLEDTGERMIPPEEGEVSFVYSRHRFAYEYALNYVDGFTVIDVGCGAGYGCDLMATKASYVLGVDYSPEAIAYCQARYTAPNLQFSQMNASSLDVNQIFDVATSFQVIEHMEDVNHFIQEMKRVVRPGGTILISTPNVRTKQKAGEGNPFHFNEMNHDEFVSFIAANFTSFKILGVSYSRPNRLRQIIQKLPFYKLGVHLARRNRIKQVANKALGLTSFSIIESNVADMASDLLAVCCNE